MCGKNAWRIATSTIEAAGVSPRYTSTTYEIAWKVKNEIPIGSTIWTSGIDEPRPIESSALSVSETKKLRYLKTASRPRSNATAAISARLRVTADGVRAITCAATVLTTLDAISSSTQRQSIQP